MHAPLRFTFVLTRYGPRVLGGGEKLARDVAERLAARGHDVRVLTTCATRYTNWANELPAGVEDVGGVEVRRFPVRIGRLRPLDAVAKEATSFLPRIELLGRLWAWCQGPFVPGLVRACVREAPDRDLTVFFSWLYLPGQQALARIGPRSALVPLVHEEPPLYTTVARATLQLPRMLFVNTEEEWARIERITGKEAPVAAIVAVGADPPPPRNPDFVPPTSDPYLLVLGRSGKAKPVLSLWRALADRAASSSAQLELEDGPHVGWERLKLVTVGETSRAYDGIPGVVQLGFVDEATRWQLLWNCIALVNPSVHESLSLVLLEAWSCGRPVIVHQRCDVTVGQVHRSGGGIAIGFDEPLLGAVQLQEGLASAGRRTAMGRAGRAYVTRRYRWDHVLDAYEAAAQAMRAGGSIAAALSPWSPPVEPAARPAMAAVANT